MVFLTSFLVLFGSVFLRADVSPVQDVPQVILKEIQAETDLKKLFFPAQIQAEVQSTVTADLDGYVTQIKKPLGSIVKKGEVILTIENKDPAFTYAAVPVRAPFAGTLSQMAVQQMSKVQKGSELFQIFKDGSVKVILEVPAAEISYLRTGMTGTFKQSGLDDTALSVQVVGLSPVMDPRTGTARAQLQFVQKTGEKVAIPLVGSVGQVNFEIAKGQIVLLPETAVKYFEGQPSIRVMKTDKTTYRKKIVLGEKRDDLYVVKAGLEQGDQVVVRANKSIKDGEVVEAKKKDAE